MYYPEETSTGYFLTGIAEGLAPFYEVHTLCAQPTYSRRGLRGPAREVRNGVSIHRCPSTTLNKDVFALKLINALTITLSLFVYSLGLVRRGDVVLVATNPPVLPFLALLACRLRGAACVLLMQDVYFPDGMVAAGMIRQGGVVARLLDWVNAALYRRMARIAVLGRDMAALVLGKLGGRGGERISIVRNWADLDEVAPAPKSENDMLRELGLAGKFVLQFAGNMGRMHGIEMLFEAARLLAESDPEAHFLFIGSGARRPWLERAVRSAGLSNVTIVGNQSRERQQVFLNACDVAITAFVPGMFGVGVPSRLYNILATGRPLIAAVDPESEMALVIREEGTGWVVPPNQPDRFAEAVRAAKSDTATLAEMGRRARLAAERKYSQAAAVAGYRTLVEDVIVHPPRGGRLA